MCDPINIFIQKHYNRELCANDYSDDFKQSLNILTKLESNLVQYSSQYPRDGVPTEHQTWEITIRNIHHPQHHVDSYWWIYNIDIDKWWPTPEEINLLQKWGWVINQHN
jgi:hypothetical protein